MCSCEGFHSLALLRGTCEGLLPVPSEPRPGGRQLHQPCSVVRLGPCPYISCLGCSVTLAVAVALLRPA